METEKLYWEDAYQKEFNAKILEIHGNDLILDKTAFYPTGGGQPNDTGKIICNGTEYEVIDVNKKENIILHTLKNIEGLNEGMDIKGIIEWDRRYMHMRYHTALHILDGIANKEGRGKITGGQIYTDRARIDFDAAGIDREVVQQIINDAQKVIDEDHKVIAKFLSKEEALSIKDLSRTDPGSE
ncbi:MAG: alanyl-tRNA editing protein, partial [Candidatus Micrarchaeaceae archaeon]